MLGLDVHRPVALFYLGKGRFYYISRRLPHAAGHGRSRCRTLAARLRRPVPPHHLRLFSSQVSPRCGAYICALIIPLAVKSGPLRDFALQNNGDLREEFGWEELVQTVAAIRDSLPPDQQANVGILVGNYGEQGAIEMLGPAYHLPLPMSLTNSAWLRGYPTPPPDHAHRRSGSVSEEARPRLHRLPPRRSQWQLARRHNEESQYHPDIFVCGPPRQPWPIFWKEHQSFG